MAKQNDKKDSEALANVIAIKQTSKRAFRMLRATEIITIYTILVLILVELVSCTKATADVSNSNYYSNENLGKFFAGSMHVFDLFE